MSSLRKIQSARANAALAAGPKTPEGKRRSSLNSLRHGLLARCIVLPNESEDGFKALLEQYLVRFGPLDDVELGMVEEMAAVFWRLRRAWAIENGLFAKTLESQAPGDEIARIASVFSALAATPQLSLLHRYEARLHTIFQRALHNLLLLRTPGPNEPNPISGHSDPP